MTEVEAAVDELVVPSSKVTVVDDVVVSSVWASMCSGRGEGLVESEISAMVSSTLNANPVQS